MASTDNVGVTGYRVERCQGGSCSGFTQVGTTSGPSYVDTGLAASTAYSYRVRAVDGSSNVSGPSTGASATTLSGAAPVAITLAPAHGQGRGNDDVVVPGISGRSTLREIGLG